MRQIALHRDFDQWRQIGRRLLVEEVPPEQVVWTNADQPTLLPIDDDVELLPASPALTVPRSFVQIARIAACHRDPARIKQKAMRKEMPVRHWATLPETQIIPDLLRDAPRRVEEMVRKTQSIYKPKATSAADFLPRHLENAHLELPQLIAAAKKCQGCSICCNATQTVFGEGPAHALWCMATIHPSALLRMPDDQRAQAVAEFAQDLKKAAMHLRSLKHA
jgi:hypothetical protein